VCVLSAKSTSHLVVDHIRRQTAAASDLVRSHRADLAVAAAGRSPAWAAVEPVAVVDSRQAVVAAGTEAVAAAAVAAARSQASVIGQGRHRAAGLRRLQVSNSNHSILCNVMFQVQLNKYTDMATLTVQQNACKD